MRHELKGTKQNRKKQHRRPVRGENPKRSSRSRRNATPPRTAKQLFALPKQAQNQWIQATHVVSKMRADGDSLSRASREFGFAPKVVIRLARPALRKRRNGRYAAKPADNLLRVLAIPNERGIEEIALRDSREATRLSKYWIAVHAYLQTGDASLIKQFRGKGITDANGNRVRLVIDLDILDRLGNAGNLSFETIYPK